MPDQARRNEKFGNRIERVVVRVGCLRAVAPRRVYVAFPLAVAAAEEGAGDAQTEMKLCEWRASGEDQSGEIERDRARRVRRTE